jgi:hypothetical protein
MLSSADSGIDLQFFGSRACGSQYLIGRDTALLAGPIDWNSMHLT